MGLRVWDLPWNHPDQQKFSYFLQAADTRCRELGLPDDPKELMSLAIQLLKDAQNAA